MAYYSFRIGPYARSIYLDGTKTFAQVAVESSLYAPAIKEYAANNFTYYQIDLALTNGYISQQEYDETIALKAVIEPRPVEAVADVHTAE